MITIPKEKMVYAMDASNPPVLNAQFGEPICFETYDALEGQITREDQSIDAIDWEKVNPATGPVYFEGAEPGDALIVHIEKIELVGKGVVAAIPDLGIWGDEVKRSQTMLATIDGDWAHLPGGLKLPVMPMIGVIGTAPASGGVSCGTPGDHGGNMDCKKIAPGTQLILPVFHSGGLLAMGDVHAAMGDGEIMGTGIEIGAKITVSVELWKQAQITSPLLQTQDMLYAIASAHTMEEAAKQAASQLRQRICQTMQMEDAQAGMLISVAGQVEVCQIVDPKVTLRVGIPREYAKIDG